MIKPPQQVSLGSFQKRFGDCSILIVAAGFEARARRVLESLSLERIPRIVLVRYKSGVPENDANFETMKRFLARSVGPEVVAPILDLRHPDEFLHKLKGLLSKWQPDSSGEVWVDISALPMQGICMTLAAVRQTLSGRTVRILYTEAAEYFPTKKESTRETVLRSAMSQEMFGNLVPKQFAGSSSEGATCLIVFAGYEKHRSIGVVDELNPSKLVLVFGRPPRQDLQWRLRWSQKLHEQIKGTRPTAYETVSTFDPLDSLKLLNTYYGFLFADHNITISPVCSKMQCISCYLMWERYRDTQLVFPLPVSYLPRRFSLGYSNTYCFVLPTTDELTAVLPSSLSVEGG